MKLSRGMCNFRRSRPRLLAAPHSIRKGSSLSDLLDREAIECLVHNITLVHPDFEGKGFRRPAITGSEPLGILQRGHHLARTLREGQGQTPLFLRNGGD